MKKAIIFFTKENQIKRLPKNIKITENELDNKVLDAKKILLKERAKRITPCTRRQNYYRMEWSNAKGYVDAYRVFDDPKFLISAIKNAEFILKNVRKSDHRLDRNF